MKRIMCILLSLLMVTGMLFAGGQKEEPKEEMVEEEKVVEEAEPAGPSLVTSISAPLEIEFWHAMSSKLGETVVMLTDEFNATVGKEKGITVTAVFQGGYGDLKQKTTAAIKAGTTPVIAQAYPDWVAEYMQADIVVPLDDYIYDPEVGIKDFDDIFPGYREENSQYGSGGTFYSLPFNKSTEVLFYNKTFFDANGYSVPETWDELVELSKTIYETTGKPGFGYDALDNYMITMIRQFGGKYTDSMGNIYFTEGDAAVKAIELYQENFDKGYWRVAGEDRYLSGPFNNGDIYMYIGSTAGAAYVGSDMFVWDSAPIPYITSSRKAVIQQGTNIFLMNQDKTDEEVYAGFEFAKFLVSKGANFTWATNTGYLPIRKSVADSPEYKEFLSTTVDTTKLSGPAQGSYYFFDPGFYKSNFTSYDVRRGIRGALEDALLNKTDAATALQTAYDKLQ